MKSLARPVDKAEVLRRLRALSPESRRRWGRMSAHQMVCHLSDSFLCVMGRKPVSHATSAFQRTFVKWLALYVPLPWLPGIRTRPEIDQYVGGTKPAEFAADVAQLEALVGMVTEPSRRFRSRTGNGSAGAICTWITTSGSSGPSHVELARPLHVPPLGAACRRPQAEGTMKRSLQISVPTLVSVAITRAMMGVGAGMLLSQKIARRRRRRLGLVLLALGAASTIPIGLRVFGGR